MNNATWIMFYYKSYPIISYTSRIIRHIIIHCIYTVYTVSYTKVPFWISYFGLLYVSVFWSIGLFFRFVVKPQRYFIKPNQSMYRWIMARNKMIPGLIIKSILNTIFNTIYVSCLCFTVIFDRSHRDQEFQDLLCQLPNARHSIRTLDSNKIVKD